MLLIARVKQKKKEKIAAISIEYGLSPSPNHRFFSTWFIGGEIKVGKKMLTVIMI